MIALSIQDTTNPTEHQNVHRELAECPSSATQNLWYLSTVHAGVAPLES